MSRLNDDQKQATRGALRHYGAKNPVLPVLICLVNYIRSADVLFAAEARANGEDPAPLARASDVLITELIGATCGGPIALGTWREAFEALDRVEDAARVLADEPNEPKEKN